MLVITQFPLINTMVLDPLQSHVVTEMNRCTVNFVLTWKHRKDNFKNMTQAIGLLPSLFCKQVKFAVITFSDYIMPSRQA